MANVKIRTGLFSTPPRGFRPLTASDDDLRKHGFPVRPTHNPKVLARWEELMAQEQNYVQPVFTRNEGVRHGPPMPVDNNQTSNWSGVTFSESSAFVADVHGEWTIPSITAPQPNLEAHVSCWVGIDDGPAILQAGSHSIVDSNGATSQYLWWEWFPDVEIAISNIPIQPGNVVYFTVTANSEVSGTIYLFNQTTGASTSFNVLVYQQLLSCRMAEWIVERPTINNVISHLPFYGEVEFTLATGTANDGRGILPNDFPATAIDMVNDNGIVISKTTVEGDISLNCKYIAVS